MVFSGRIVVSCESNTKYLSLFRDMFPIKMGLEFSHSILNP